MKNDYLLTTDRAKRLYFEYAKDLPIIDFHNHVCVADVADNRKFDSLYELWLACDPYKHRLMRICGVDEHFITGDADPFEKFEKYCSVFPYVAGNPVFDWSKMELSTVFGIDTLPCKDNARYIYDKCGEMLKSSEYYTKAILDRFNVEYQSPVATVLDGLSAFDGKSIAPSLRGDNLLDPSRDLIEALKVKTGVCIDSKESYVNAVSVVLDRFDSAGCRFADHSLDFDFFDTDTAPKQTEMLRLLGNEYAKRGWTLLLHVGAKRQTSPRLLKLAGTAGGYAAAGEGFPVSKLCNLLADMESAGGLPDTVLFPLNLADQPSFAVLQGSFSEDGVASKVQLGPAWWWCDNAFGIRNTLECISSFGVLSQFIGMTTDSRSILSFVRHDYFRRILCSFIDTRDTEGEWELPFEILSNIAVKICYQNAKDKIIRGKLQ